MFSRATSNRAVKSCLPIAALMLGATALFGACAASASAQQFGPAIGPPPKLQSYFNWTQDGEDKSRIVAWMSPDVYDRFFKTGLDTPLGRIGVAPGPGRALVDGEVYDYVETIGSGSEGGRTLFVVRLKTAVLAPLAGEWSSNWGQVTFRETSLGTGVNRVSGFWMQGGSKGLIKEGTFDPQTRKLVFTFYQDWNDQNGRAELTMSEDGKTLSGTYVQDNGPGSWTMWRGK
jgi:hypothetical protein